MASRSMFLVLCFLGEPSAVRPLASGPSYGSGGVPRGRPLPAAPGRRTAAELKWLSPLFQVGTDNPSY